MNNNDRDTHFSSFAEALWDELETAIQQDPGFIPEGQTRRETFLPTMQTIIAQRAYDLVAHALKEMNPTPYTYNDTPEQIIHTIPDMLKLPQVDS